MQWKLVNRLDDKEDFEGIDVVDEYDEQVVCSLPNTDGALSSEELRNTFLIKAAPDMYEILKELIKVYGPSLMGPVPEFMLKVAAAIDKAEGR